jgi:benzoyl-CoA 2,3-dioxygenase component B
MWAGQHFSPEGQHLSAEAYQAQVGGWLPSADDEVYIKSLMVAVTEPGKMAGWIAPPQKGINNLPGDFAYVRA